MIFLSLNVSVQLNYSHGYFIINIPTHLLFVFVIHMRQ